MFDDYLNSDELRTLTHAGSSIFQVEKRQKLGVPFSLDPYGTPLVHRRDLDVFLRTHLEPIYDKLRLDFNHRSGN